jgi:hypothetical protein
VTISLVLLLRCPFLFCGLWRMFQFCNKQRKFKKNVTRKDICFKTLVIATSYWSNERSCRLMNSQLLPLNLTVSEILYIGLRTKTWLCIYKHIVGTKIWEVSPNGDLYHWSSMQRSTSITFRWFVNLINYPPYITRTCTLCSLRY